MLNLYYFSLKNSQEHWHAAGGQELLSCKEAYHDSQIQVSGISFFSSYILFMGIIFLLSEDPCYLLYFSNFMQNTLLTPYIFHNLLSTVTGLHIPKSLSKQRFMQNLGANKVSCGQFKNTK